MPQEPVEGAAAVARPSRPRPPADEASRRAAAPLAADSPLAGDGSLPADGRTDRPRRPRPPAVPAEVDASVVDPSEPVRRPRRPRPGGAAAGAAVLLDDPAPTPSADEPVVDEEAGPSPRLRNLIEWAAVIIGALVVALLLKTFLFQAYYIPSESMVPTLEEGDRIVVNKLSYKLHDVNRGDLVVFAKPEAAGDDDDIKDLVKRVIGLPGETVEVSDGRIYIDGRLLEEPYLAEGIATSGFTPVAPCANPATELNRCVIPEGHVFVMGDNRPVSRDSRFFGPVPEDGIVGRAAVQVWPLGDLGWL
jgi:signal peptidase I